MIKSNDLVLWSSVLMIFITKLLYTQSVSFTKSSQVFLAAETFQIKLADIDSDGDLDAISANMGNNNSKIWINDGTGYFTDSGQLLTKQGHGIGIEDLDGDGDLDLIIPCAIYITNTGQFNYRPTKIYFNDGSGMFIDSGQNLGDSLLSKTFVQLVDYDCDNDFDAVIQHFSPPKRIYYKVYNNNGSGIFTLSDFTLPDNSFPNWVDINLDGDVDIFLQKENEGYSVLLNDGSGNYTQYFNIADTTASFNENTVCLNDFDGDGDIDAFIVPGKITTVEPAKVFFNDGTGNFSDSGQELGSFNWCWVEAADLDKDNDLDIVIASFGKPTQVWLNNGNGSFFDSGLRLGGNNSYHGLDIGDLDNDGDLDLFIAFFGQGSNEIWFNDLITSVKDDGSYNHLPTDFKFLQNYPNPFNPETTIEYYIPETSIAQISIFNSVGEKVAELLNEIKNEGYHNSKWNGSDLSSGVYFVRLMSYSIDENYFNQKTIKAILQK
jgi:hypothetical protein